MAELDMAKNGAHYGGPASFLLAQIGSYAAARFGERLAPLGFAPYHAGILRILAESPGISQQDLAAGLNMHASRLVSVVDELQKQELLVRRPSEHDRRLYALHLTPQGKEALEKIGVIAREHNQAMLSGLSPEQQKRLTELLELISKNQDLRPGIHPGYRQLRQSKLRS